jgi:hypothetical protein
MTTLDTESPRAKLPSVLPPNFEADPEGCQNSDSGSKGCGSVVTSRGSEQFGSAALARSRLGS